MTLKRRKDPEGSEAGDLRQEQDWDPARLRELHLAGLWKLKPSDLRRLQAAFRSGLLPIPWTQSDLSRLGGRLSTGLKQELAQRAAETAELRDGRELARLGIHFLMSGDPEFPPCLAEIPDPPPYLFVRGAPFALPGAPRVAVIGSRAASETGLELAYGLGRDLALAGCVVVSGLARGIDAQAHRGALEAGGLSVAVLGTGCDLCYPPEHSGLFGRILRQGGIVTEFPPGTPGVRLNFPRRNRILSGLCRAVVVVEGAERSGARSTVDHALDQGREVLAVPRDPIYPGSILPNRLIRDGARPVLDLGDLLNAIGAVADPRGGEPSPAQGAVSTVEGRLLDLLRRRAAGLDACLEAIPHIGPGAIQAALVRLEIQGRVRRRPGGRYQAV